MVNPAECKGTFMVPKMGAIEAILKKMTPTAQMKLFGLMKIPLLFLVNPKVTQLNEDVCEVKVPLSYITKNHVGSMYFGALAIGADTVVLMHALHIGEKNKGVNVVGIFKDLHVEFLKRAEGDVTFRCTAGADIKNVIEKARATGERITQSIPVEASTITDGNRIVVAKFSLGLSVKAKN
jgi:acyl-coenzyme A thioesterase PaaI-like protein